MLIKAVLPISQERVNGYWVVKKVHYTMLQLKIFIKLYSIFFLFGLHYEKNIFNTILHVLRNGRYVTYTEKQNWQKIESGQSVKER